MKKKDHGALRSASALSEEETDPRTSVRRLRGDVRDEMVDDASMPLLWRGNL
jgi:hypothetical protein